MAVSGSPFVQESGLSVWLHLSARLCTPDLRGPQTPSAPSVCSDPSLETGRAPSPPPLYCYLGLWDVSAILLGSCTYRSVFDRQSAFLGDLRILRSAGHVTRHISNSCCCCLGFPSDASGKEPACQCRRRERRGFNP